MRRAFGLLALLVILALLVAACGPKMATPTPQSEEVAQAEPTDAEPEEEESPEAESEAPQDLPVDADDWHVLGSPDAPVTMIEYSDFQ